MLYAGALAIVFLALSVLTIKTRAKASVNLGDGGNPALQRIMRGHGNFAEYVPLILILMALLETQGSSRAVMHGLGAALLAARLIHGYTFAFTEKFFLGRMVGASATLLVLAVAGILCIVSALNTL